MILLEILILITTFPLSDGVFLIMEQNIGLEETPGDLIGARKDSSKLLEEPTIWVLKVAANGQSLLTHGPMTSEIQQTQVLENQNPS